MIRISSSSLFSLFLVRPDETLLRLDQLDTGRPLERRRRRFAGAARTADGTEPVFKTRRRDEPQEAHLLAPGVHHLVLKPAPNEDHGLGAHIVAPAFHIGIAATAVAE